MSLRVVLADDHVVLRQGVRALLERHGFEVVAEASDGRTAVEVTRQHERSEEHTSELQSHSDLVCRLLLEKKKQTGVTDQAIHWNYAPDHGRRYDGRVVALSPA